MSDELKIKEVISYEYDGRQYASKEEIRDFICRRKIHKWIYPDIGNVNDSTTISNVLTAMKERPEVLAEIMKELVP